MRNLIYTLLMIVLTCSTHETLADSSVLSAKDEQRYDKFIEKGNYELRWKNYNVALKFFLKAAELKPEEYTPWHNAGLATYNLKDYKSTIRYFNKALDQEPSSMQTLGLLLGAYYESKQYLEALAKILFTNSVLIISTRRRFTPSNCFT